MRRLVIFSITLRFIIIYCVNKRRANSILGH